MSLWTNWRRKRREKRLTHDIETAGKMLKRIDDTMQSLNVPRWKRKQMWRDFIKSEDQRTNVLKILEGAKP